jgi:hypothetical protein
MASGDLNPRRRISIVLQTSGQDQQGVNFPALWQARGATASE